VKKKHISYIIHAISLNTTATTDHNIKYTGLQKTQYNKRHSEEVHGSEPHSPRVTNRRKL